MGSRKTILLGVAAMMLAVHAHGLLACQLHRASHPANEPARKCIRITELSKVHIDRHDADYAPIFSRRVILQ